MGGRRTRAGVAAVALATVLGLAASGATAYPLLADPLVQVSGVSPFLGCTADDVGSQSGTVFLNSEVEPWIDINPLDADNLVGAWQQDRWSNGGARGLVAGVSMDGGATWTEVVIPGVSLCSGGQYDRSTDPWVSFSPNGRLHQLALSFNDVAPPFEARDFDHALLASYSDDGGLTWSAPVEVIRDLDANVFNDKQTITADPHDPNLVYAVWDRLVFPTSERAAVIAGFVTFSFRGPAYFARSTDGGVTWEPARKIYDPGQENQTIGNQIVVTPDGDLVNVMDVIYNFKNKQGVRGLNVAVLRSEDKGMTWSKNAIVVSKLQTVEIHDPDTGDPVRTGDIIPDIAVDPASGALYTVWQDARFSGMAHDSIALSRSLDGGLTWSQPIKVNQTPSALPSGNQQAFTPSVHVSSDGTVGVTYYDFRNNTPDPATLPTDYFAVHCEAASEDCTDPGSWTGSETQITPAPFDMRQTPFARGFFTGDYEGLTADGLDFLPFFSQSHAGDPASIFFSRVHP